jgi:E3 ubiquitin-protein ligase MYLIP
MLCLVTMPDTKLLAIETERTSDGRRILQQVCEKIGSLETDYFGLKYTSSCGELLWLNLRNRVTSEVTGPQPYRLQLKIKFFVLPHFVLQESTREQFYITLRNDFTDGTLEVDSVDDVIQLSSLLAQSEQAINTSLPFSVLPTTESCLPSGYRTESNLASLVQQLETSELNPKESRSRFLQKISELHSYGVHYFRAHDEQLRKNLNVGIGARGITLSDDENRIIYSVRYAALQKAIHDGLAVDIWAVQDNASVLQHRLTLPNKCAANALYRDLTEMYSFFHCDTVGSVVAQQFCRDLKGTFLSLFNERTHLGKKYVFDIERTLREACDHTRRALHNIGASSVHVQHAQNTSASSAASELRQSTGALYSHMALSLQRLQDFHSSFTCHLCADSEINTVLVPCGHMICCSECADKLSSCPLCKQCITLKQPVFLPSTRAVITSTGISLAETNCVKLCSETPRDSTLHMLPPIGCS